MRHISFDQFHQRLLKCCQEVLEIQQLRQYKHVVLLVPGELNKSNFWCSLLATALLLPILTDVGCFVESRTDLSWKGNSWMPRPNAETLYITCDDCIYSGSQLYESLSDAFACDYKVLNLALVCPFICNKSRFAPTCTDVPYIRLPSTQYFDTLRTMVKKTEQGKYWIERWYDLPVLSFDHKVADHKSIYSNIYNCEFLSCFKDGIIPTTFPRSIQYTFHEQTILTTQTSHDFILKQACSDCPTLHCNFNIALLKQKNKKRKRQI